MVLVTKNLVSTSNESYFVFATHPFDPFDNIDIVRFDSPMPEPSTFMRNSRNLMKIANLRNLVWINVSQEAALMNKRLVVRLATIYLIYSF